MKDTLKSAMKDAMKAKQKVRLTTIRAILSAIQYEEIEQKTESIAEKDIIAILKNEEKKRVEGIEMYTEAGRTDDVAQLTEELECIRSFLPEQLSEEKLTALLEAFKAQNSGANMGDAMKHLKEGYNGQYDGKLASNIAKSVFS